MPIKVAIVGSGPAGFYTASALLKACPSCEIDIIERLADMLREFGNKPFAVTPDMMSLPGCTAEALVPLLEGLGYVAADPDENGTAQFRRPSLNERNRQMRKAARKQAKGSGKGTKGKKENGRGRNRGKAKPKATINKDSPFAALKDMLNG